MVAKYLFLTPAEWVVTCQDPGVNFTAITSDSTVTSSARHSLMEATTSTIIRPYGIAAGSIGGATGERSAWRIDYRHLPLADLAAHRGKAVLIASSVRLGNARSSSWFITRSKSRVNGTSAFRAHAGLESVHQFQATLAARLIAGGDTLEDDIATSKAIWQRSRQHVVWNTPTILPDVLTWQGL